MKSDRVIVLRPLSAAARRARRPLPPEALIDARHDRVGNDRGGSRPARVVRRPVIHRRVNAKT